MISPARAPSLSEANRRSHEAEETVSRAEPGSQIDMQQHLAFYRGFLFILRTIIIVTLLFLGAMAYVLT